MIDLDNRLLEEIGRLPVEEQAPALKILQDTVSGDLGAYTALWQVDYDERPPTIEEFLTLDEYLGKLGVDIYPVWRRDLEAIFKPGSKIYEWVATGSLGIGKTTIAVIALLYKVVQIVCLKNPQEYYGMMKNSEIVFGLFNVYKYLSRDMGYAKFKSAMQISPFNRIGLKNKKGDIVGLPKNITIAIGAQAVQGLGQSLYGGMINETNFGKSSSYTSEEQSQMQDLYTQTRDRIASRFLTYKGNNPGFLILCSSKRDQTDFLDKHMEKVVGNAGVYISDYALWEAKEKLKTSKIFRVFCGDERRNPKILSDDDTVQAADKSNVVEVPDTPYFRERFSYSLPDAIRNLAGRSTHGKRKFIFNRELFWKTIQSGTKRDPPFTVETAYIGIDHSTRLVEYVDRSKILKLVDKTNDIWMPLYYPKGRRIIHVDLAKNQDSAGMAMGCVRDIQRIDKIDEQGHRYKTFAVNVWMDFMIRISAVSGSQIDFEQIRELIFWLRDNHFFIDTVSYDWWQSTDSIQMLLKAGINAKQQSIDRTRAPYEILKSLLLEGRFDSYVYPIFSTEVLALNDLGDTIDHPVGQSKDVSDAVAGVVFGLLTRKHTEHESYVDPKAEIFSDHTTSADKETAEDTRLFPGIAKHKSRHTSLEDFFKRDDS